MEIEKRSNYIRLPTSEQLYRAYVMTCEGPLNLHVHIHDLSEEMKKRYESARNYRYNYISEEYPSKVLSGTIYICHLKGIELGRDSYSTREAGIWMKKQIDRSVGWFLVRLSDIDVYQRILVTLYTPEESETINEKLLSFRTRLGTQIAFEYVRPQRERIVYFPEKKKIPTYYFCDLFEKNESEERDEKRWKNSNG